MKPMSRFAVAAGVVALAASCTCAGRDADTIGTSANPAVVLVSASHARTASPASLDTIARVLREKSGMTVVVQVAKDPVTAIETFGAARADVGLLNLTEYFLARQEFGVDARLQVLRDREPRNAYFAVLAVRADNSAKDVAALRGARVAFVDEFSVSGFAYPAVLLRDLDVEPQFAGSHERAVALVKEGSALAAATYEELVQNDTSLRVLARTAAIPNEPIVVRRGLSDEVARKLIDALSALPQNAEGLAALKDVADIAGFVPATATTFDGALSTLREAGRSAEALVPGGRALVLRNSPILNAPPASP